MSIPTIVICALLLLVAVFVIVAVLMQQGKSHNLSGTIAGGAETFFGKQKGKSMDALFNKLTTVIAIIFVLLVVVLYVMQPEADLGEGVVVPEVEAAGDEVAEDEGVEGDVVEGDVVEGVEGEAEVAPEAEAEAAPEVEVEAEVAPETAE